MARIIKNMTPTLKASDAVPDQPTSNSKPVWVAPPTPRASGVMADGKPQGNYQQPAVSVGAGTGPQVDVAEDE